MSALDTRTYITANQNHYLCPIPAFQIPAAKLQTLLAPVWTDAQALTPVYLASETTTEATEHLAYGFSQTITLINSVHRCKIFYVDLGCFCIYHKHITLQYGLI
ncbi:hypothetical protein TI04_06270 [Achromatium sp. WMS2]|nr:hypothetical protein TI04_06270 [Achromatium sp. WMS2]